jgi:hypothetical protein
MNTLPGFTADASLYPNRGQYRAAAANRVAGTAVVPQMAAGVGFRARTGRVRDVTCCGLDECWWSESTWTCALELVGDACEEMKCIPDAGCLCVG